MAILSSYFNTGPDLSDFDPFPQLCAATDRLRRFAADDRHSLDEAGQKLLEEALAAAAEAEQSIAVQRARIRFLESLSVTDELTQVLNRRGFDVEMTRALARADRLKETGVLILCDLDHFKAVNDCYGHPAGDEVLKSVARFLQNSIRETDVVGRLGGDEFAMLFTHTTIPLAKQRCHMMERTLNALKIDWQGAVLTTSVSFGMAPYGPGSKAASLFILADRNLYQDKGPRPELVVG